MTHDHARHCFKQIEMIEKIEHDKTRPLIMIASAMIAAPRPMPSPIVVGVSSDRESVNPLMITASSRNTVAMTGSGFFPSLRVMLDAGCSLINNVSWV